MLVLCRDDDGWPMVAEIGHPRTAVAVTDVSEHHITVLLDDGRDQLHLVLARDVAALLVLRLLAFEADHVAWLEKHGDA